MPAELTTDLLSITTDEEEGDVKLLRCEECNDIVKLRRNQWRHCDCAASRGRYHDDGIRATVEGPCRVILIGNGSLRMALAGMHHDTAPRPDDDRGVHLWAMVAGYEHPRIEYGDRARVATWR